MRKMICILLATFLLVLCGCGKEQAPENPYRIKQQILERYLENGTLITRTEHIYDENGLIQTDIACEADGTQRSKHIATFDEYGNELEVVAYSYSFQLSRYGETNEEPDSRTTNVYELKNEPNT